MNKKVFSETQIIMFGAIIGLALLVLLPLSHSFKVYYEQERYEKNIMKAIDASKSWLNSQNNDKESYYVSVSELVKSKILNKSNLTGCVKINYNEKTKNHIYSYINNNCENIITIKDRVLDNIVDNGDGLYQVDNKYIFKGNNPNNYILINNSIYRILSIDNNGIKVISNESITSKEFDSKESRNNDNNTYCLDSINGCNIYMSNGVDVLDDSDIYEYLENVYSNSTSYLVKTNWDLSLVSKIDELGEENTITSNIGLLTIKDYLDSKINNSWLNNGEDYWTFTGVKDNNYQVWYITSSGKIDKKNADEIIGVRPVLNISSNLKASGSGTIDNPYILR